MEKRVYKAFILMVPTEGVEAKPMISNDLRGSA